jgi:hypothetical protein
MASVAEGVDARFFSGWLLQQDGFEDGGFGGWTVVVGAVP